ncbi:MAG: pantoate--beta-alanine ligase [Bacteroidetes bacterium]|nr:pantoate--beta-alanine ligase [Bacteroidota bacterium]
MLIFTKIGELQEFLVQKKTGKISVGFVPTMGALHPGHISLVEASKKVCDLTVCSIFVNPTQFNDKSDLDRYPKTPQTDLEMLKSAHCDVVFMPSSEEMYPEKDERKFDFGYLDKILEGDHRPGHFNGVAQVVSRLFDAVRPDKAFFGSKDYQQVMVIRALVKLLNYEIEIVTCPTLRESDGLAMSSRNALLNPKEREVSKIIPKLMQEARELKKKGKEIPEIKEHIVSELNKRGNYELDYFTICDAETLKEINSFSEAKKHVALIACYVGKIRLIDNVLLN